MASAPQEGLLLLVPLVLGLGKVRQPDGLRACLPACPHAYSPSQPAGQTACLSARQARASLHDQRASQLCQARQPDFHQRWQVLQLEQPCSMGRGEALHGTNVRLVYWHGASLSRVACHQ